jgi:hypothetical protein
VTALLSTPRPGGEPHIELTSGTVEVGNDERDLKWRNTFKGRDLCGLYGVSQL